MADRFSPCFISVWHPQRIWQTVGTAAIAVSLWATPSLAKDPFRTSNLRPIGDNTEAAFRSVFEQGNYKSAESSLSQAEANEPLAFALKAFLAYSNSQGESDRSKKQAALDSFKNYATQTRQSAEQLVKTDPLRGNLYIAVGNFLEGVYVVGSQGVVRGTPQALGNLQQAFKYLDEAEKIDPKDPELNLLKGYIDLLLAVNVSLPLSSPTQAIERLETYAAPRYLADRGLALGYRDLNQPDKALKAINQAIAAAPKNPELSYLKAQILVRQGNNRESIPLFEKALSQKDQLPNSLTTQIQKELDRTLRRIQNKGQ
ncbi:MAG: tetratricopeptide repeat protein [Candidatus Parcubacteria bacterium]|nr:tetratricopeptide repeat protein [Leptolyngbyaceae cyanobacterium LF-bin-113]